MAAHRPVARETSPQPAAPLPRPEPRPAPVVPLVLPPDSGLEMVETRHAAPPADDESAGSTGPRRVRPPKVQVADEPLQMVETRPGEQPPATP